MQNTQSTQQTPEVLKPEDGVFLKELPPELLGKIRPEDWNTMTESQKRETLTQNNLTKYLTPEKASVPTTELPTAIPEAPTTDPELPVEGEINVGELGKDAANFEAAKLELQNVEQNQIPEETPLDTQEQARVDTESGQNLKPQKKVKFFGYQPSPQLVNNADDIAENGDISDGRTWAAGFLKKLLAIFS